METSRTHFKKLPVFLFLLLLVPAILMAEVKLPAIFGDNMVLQQQTNAAIWGKASPNKQVRVTTSWDKRSYTARSDNSGNWKLNVHTPAAGGPYSITFSDGKELKLNNVLIGEVWVCSGQSNMQMTMTGYRNEPILGSNEAIATSLNRSIRLYTVQRNTSLEKLDDFEGQWLECQPENVANFSAAGYFFGRMIQQALDVPVGLIVSSWGGTRIEPWMSAEGLQYFDWVNVPVDGQNEKINQNSPTVLFNAMINPMAGYAIRGGLWYQGESNRNEPDRYRQLMPGLVENWRKAWGIGEFPFYFVQLAPYDYGITGLNSALLREAQLKASAVIPNSGMACIMDAGERNSIHPANKKAVGERLAFLALARTYGKNGVSCSGPVLKEMVVEGSLVKLTFDHADNGLTSYGKELENFMVAGENKRFYPAKAFITRTGITLYSPAVENPVAVRYAFDDFVVGELFNTEGIPASSFRTDNW